VGELSHGRLGCVRSRLRLPREFKLAHQNRGAWDDPARAKEAGFEAKTATPEVLSAVVRRLLPAELRSRGIADPVAVCTKIALRLDGMVSEPAAETAEAVFKRLGGD
jgi:hypothetical protein